MPPDVLAEIMEVLVVDDEAGVRELLIEYFKSLGFRVTGAPDGPAAIGLLQRSHGRYGLVITDLNLPGADGFAVLQAARQASAGCYVVIVTGHASLESAIRAVRVGAYDYLAKPFSFEQLGVILARIRERVILQRATHRSPPATRDPAAILPPSPAASKVEKRLEMLEASLHRIERLMSRHGGSRESDL
ncbi:MAG: response regulator [Acidobacteria bacterium]|nr:response regulator [Acidobacteriota bacterium]